MTQLNTADPLKPVVEPAKAEPPVPDPNAEKPPVPDPPAAPTPEPAGETLIADKFKTPEDLGKGYDALVDKLGLKGIAPEKFDSTDDAVAAYKLLEAKLGTQAPEPDPSKPLEIKAAEVDAGTQTPIGVSEILAMTGQKPEVIADQFREHGELTLSQYEAFEKITVTGSDGKPQPLSRAIVDNQLQGSMAIAQLNDNAVNTAKTDCNDLVGGETQLTTLMAWAAEGVPKAEQAAINARLADPLQMLGAVTELNARRKDSLGAGKSNAIIDGDGHVGGTTAFKNHTEQINESKRLKAAGINPFKDKSYMARSRAMSQ